MYYSTSFGPFCTSFFCHRSNWNLPVNTLQGIRGIVTKITSACHGAKPTSLCYFIDMITPFGCQIIFVSFFLWIAYSELPAFLVKEGGLNSGKHFVSLLPRMAFCFHIFPSALLWQITETVFLLCLILDGYWTVIFLVLLFCRFHDGALYCGVSGYVQWFTHVCFIFLPFPFRRQRKL